MIHPSAEVLSKEIGSNTSIWQYVVVLEKAVIGENCNINCHCFIENDVIIGDRVTLKSGVYLWDGIRIEDDVFIGPNVTFTNDLFPRSKRPPANFIITAVEKGASIGAHAVVLCGVRIGKYAMIGAGSVVTKDIPANTLWFGNPARMRGYVCMCGNKLTPSLECISCGKKYEKQNDTLVQI